MRQSCLLWMVMYEGEESDELKWGRGGCCGVSEKFTKTPPAC